MITIPMPDWYEAASCASVRSDYWFPDKGGTTHAAKKICADCPVRTQCLEWALDNVELWGVWGGATRLERRKLRKDVA